MGLGFSDGFKKPEEEEFWEHLCPVEGHIVGFLKGSECVWCGQKETLDNS